MTTGTSKQAGNQPTNEPIQRDKTIFKLSLFHWSRLVRSPNNKTLNMTTEPHLIDHRKKELPQIVTTYIALTTLLYVAYLSFKSHRT